MSASTFLPREVMLALVLTAGVELGFFAVLIEAGKNTTSIKPQAAPSALELPIAVQPILDDAPLLKLGSKKVKPALPEIWKKRAPVAPARTEDKSAPPSPKAKKTPDAVPTAPAATRDAGPPPPDAQAPKQTEDPVQDPAPQTSTPEVEGEGHPSGVKEGTEVDPLKARAVGQYKAKIIAWFNVRFRPPVNEIDCKTLHGLSAAISASVGADRTVTSYSVVTPSQNEIFDARVKTTMDQIVGQELPPPPPLYPDILESVVQVRLSGQGAPCDN